MVGQAQLVAAYLLSELQVLQQFEAVHALSQCRFLCLQDATVV